MSTQAQAIAYINGGWRSSNKAKTIVAAGGLGIDADGVYGFQCKDLLNDFAEKQGAPFPAGNAVVLQNGAPGWSFVSSPQAGDVALRDYISGGVNYGDGVLVMSVSGNTVAVLGQNQTNVSLTVGHIPTTAIRATNTYKKFMRRNYEAPPVQSSSPLSQYVGKVVHLAASAGTWRVYRVGSVAPREAVATLNPGKWGGLAYVIHATDVSKNSVVIVTDMFGTVSLPIAQDDNGTLYSTATIS